ncbi:hypothetical protein L1885_17950, partial [Streptomyces fuscigenes]|nr:hypothetical protein [Streptomyces fuscigenes]
MTAAGLVQSVDWLAVAPPAITAAVALIVLVADLFLEERRKPLLGALSVAGLALALLSLLPLRAGDRTTFCLTAGAGGGTGRGTGPCSYVADHFTLVIQLLVLGGALLTALLSMPGRRPSRRAATSAPAAGSDAPGDGARGGGHRAVSTA